MRIYTCNKCSKIHLEIGNTHIHFSTLEKLKTYLDYLDAIDIAYYSAINRSKGLTKEIILPLGEQLSVNLAFTTLEFETLKKIIRNYLHGSLSIQESFLGTKEFSPLNLN